MDRETKIQEIYKVAKKRNNNITTLVFLLAMLNDKKLSKFYNEYINYVKK